MILRQAQQNSPNGETSPWAFYYLFDSVLVLAGLDDW